MFPALRSRNFRCSGSARPAVNIGWWMHSVAMGWLIYDLTGSASWLGRIGFAQSRPDAPASGSSVAPSSSTPTAGERSTARPSSSPSPRRSSRRLRSRGVVEIWMIILVSLASGTGTALFMPVYQALIPVARSARSNS